MYLQQVH